MFAFDNLADFLAMGRHGFYVWSAYAVAAAVVLYNQISPRLQQRRLIADHQRRQRREQAVPSNTHSGAASQ